MSQHWNGEDKDIPRVLIEFDILLNPDKEPILTNDNLEKGNLAKQTWTPQTSGISLRKEAIDELEEEWFEFIITENVRSNPFTDPIDTVKTFIEGSSTQVTQTRYERNIYARKKCLNYYGLSC